jgi:hypothetical protein
MNAAVFDAALWVTTDCLDTRGASCVAETDDTSDVLLLNLSRDPQRYYLVADTHTHRSDPWEAPCGAYSLEVGPVVPRYIYLVAGDPILYRPGLEQPPPDWNQPGYVPDASWIASEAGFGIGFGGGDDRTELTDMQGRYVTVYARATFEAGEEGPLLRTLQLDVSVDDGFVAYLNGIEIARANLPWEEIAYDDPASVAVEEGSMRVVFDVNPLLLVSGENVFAVEVHNFAVDDDDLSFAPTLWQGP